MYYRISEMFKILNLKPQLRKLIVDVCRCGYELIVNENLTEMRCPNPVCPYHMAAKLESMCKTLGISEFGRETCFSIVTENKLQHHTQVFLLKVKDMPSNRTDKFKEKLYYENMISKKPKTLGDLIRAFEFTDFDKKAIELFENYTDINKFYADYNCVPSFIQDKLKIKKKNSITVKTIHQHLTNNEYLIKYICGLFKFDNISGFKIRVCITGSIKLKRDDGTKYSPREMFLTDMMATYKDIIVISKEGDVTRKLDFLVIDAKSTHDKALKAYDYRIPMITSEKFKAMLELCKLEPSKTSDIIDETKKAIINKSY